MTTYESLSIVIASLSAVIAIAAFFLSRRANNRSIKLSEGQVEIQIRQQISNSRQALNNVTMQCPEEERLQQSPELKERYLKLTLSAIEDLLNAYDESCGKYLDNKVDRDRFKKMYQTEIRKLFDNSDTKPYLDTVSSSFKSIRKVYDEWENYEK